MYQHNIKLTIKSSFPSYLFLFCIQRRVGSGFLQTGFLETLEQFFDGAVGHFEQGIGTLVGVGCSFVSAYPHFCFAIKHTINFEKLSGLNV